MKIIYKIKELGLKETVARINRKIDHKIRMLLHIPIRLKSIDREILDNKILPFFASQTEIKKVLFVGCEYYSQHYPSFFPGAEFWTIEPDPTRSKYGGKNHIVGFLQDLCAFSPEDNFDLIICNGVYGWGLNKAEDIEKAFDSCFSCLKNGGYFLLGWNNIPERTPVPLENIKALKLFESVELPGMGGRRIETLSRNSHIFDFYQKRVT